MIDPRPELEEDHQYWEVLLEVAEEVSSECAKTLHDIRKGGGELLLRNPVKDKSLYLTARIDPDERWQSFEEWQEAKKELLYPEKEIFIEIFQVASERVEYRKFDK